MEVSIAQDAVLQLPGLIQQLKSQHGPFQRVYSSPRERCRRMALAVDPAATVVPELAEMDFGDWEGRPWVGVPHDALDAWTADLLHYQPGGGESLQQMANRVLPWLDAAGREAQRDGSTVLVVTHGGPIRVALAMARRMPLDKAMDIPVGFGWAVRFG
jgi:alpha-ribazole phosphatase